MFFFQDDIGILIQLQKTPFWQLIFSPQAEHFVPFFKFISFVEYKIFGLSFLPYITISVLMHLVNCILLGKIIYEITGKKLFAYLAVGLFLINLTFTEPFLWFAVQGELFAVFFLGLSFLFWYRLVKIGGGKYLIWSIVLLFLSGFSYGVGEAAGLVFAAATIIYIFPKHNLGKSKICLCYFAAGIISYLLKPLLYFGKSAPALPSFEQPVNFLVTYVSFIIAGVTRGIIGRLFFPGFEPRHFEIILSAISLIPFLIIAWIFFRVWKKSKKETRLFMIILAVFVFYPYVWAGFLRAHFGLKQALAERYAYPPLFFLCILIGLIYTKIINKRNIVRKLITAGTIILVIFQTIFFLKKAADFEIKPLLTQQYFSDVQTLINKNKIILDLPLPSFVNQGYYLSDIAGLLIGDKQVKTRFIKAEDLYCTEEFRNTIKDKEIYAFYNKESRDPSVIKVFSPLNLEDCFNGVIKKV